MAPLKPVQAYCAVGPDGKIDIDLLRRNKASAQWAIKAEKNRAWPVLQGEGWKIMPVRIVPAGEPDPEPDPEPAPASSPKRNALLRCG